MIFEKGEWKKPLPAHSIVVSIFYVDMMQTYALAQMLYPELMRQRSEPEAIAKYRKYYICSLDGEGNLCIHPPAKDDIEVKVRYAPPLEEC